VMSICGISDTDLINAPPVADLIPEFVQFLGHSVLIAHNAPFDLGFLRTALLSVDIPEIGNSIIDTQALAIKAFPRRKSYSLQNLARELALPVNRAHRALDDATMCMRLFHRCVDELSFMGEMALGELLAGGY
jgi:DNA polymerase III epsilon subunit family exonuclease